MIWRKSILTGFAAAVAMIVAIVVATTTWHSNVGQGSGGVGVVAFVPSALLLFPAALAFVLGQGVCPHRGTYFRMLQREKLAHGPAPRAGPCAVY